MILNIGVGQKKENLPPLFTYTGSYSFQQSTASNGTVNWELALLGSGTLVFTRVVPAVDLFLVGGGMPGGYGWGSGSGASGQAQAGSGGAGGSRLTATNIALAEGTSYAVTIGGSGKATKGFGRTASSGGGSAGSAGATASGSTAFHAGNGSKGGYAFGASSSLIYSGRLYGPGGGGGQANNDWVTANAGAGGATGGGAGGQGSGAGGDGGANTGAGGGGARQVRSQNGVPGAGGSGIIIIRNHR